MYAESQNNNIVNKKKGWPKFGEMIKKDNATICIVVFVLAIKLTLTGFLPSFSDKN